MLKWLAILVLFWGPAAAAADLTVTVRNPAGAPVADAVVMVYPAGGAPAGAQLHVEGPLRMVQQNLQFSPFVLMVPVGASVGFPNLDRVRHHVYSFSPAKRFELKLYGHDETRSVVFDKPGAVALGCNIHDNMVAFIRVVDTPYAVKTGADGVALLRDLPAGAAQIRIWRPYLKAPGNEISLPVSLPRAGVMAQAVTADVRPPPPAMPSMY